MVQNSNSVEGYIKSFDKEVQERLNSIRHLVKKIVPDAEEGKSYGIIGFKINGRYLLYLGGFKNHISIYPFPSGSEEFKDVGKKYKTAKGTVQFPHTHPIPIEIVKRVIKYRLKEVNIKSPKIKD